MENKKQKEYYAAVGRRKTSSAQVRLYHKTKKGIVINSKKLGDYFPELELQKEIVAPLEKIGKAGDFGASVIVRGGGHHSQAIAIRHGIARALVKHNPKLKLQLKQEGYLTRDPRMRERKKFGLKRARRAPQWRKR